MFVNKLKSVFSLGNRVILIDLRKCSVQTSSKLKSSVIPETEFQQKLLKVAVIGMPNAGKSTFINSLMDRKVCPTSSKVHTTRCKSRAIFTAGDSQIVFLDTPGLVNNKEQARYNLEPSFLKDSVASLKQADIIGIIHDVSVYWTRDRLDIKILKLLETYKEKPSFLVLNKVDVLKSKRKLLDIVRLLTENHIDGKAMAVNVKQKGDPNDKGGWRNFSEVFMVSSLTGTGMSDIKDFLICEAKPAKWMFPADIWSDQTAENLILSIVKAKFLDFLPQEIPYQLEPCLELFEVNDSGKIVTVVLVKCRSERISKLVAGVGNGRLRQIIESVQQDLQQAFQNFVRINIVLEGPKG